MAAIGGPPTTRADKRKPARAASAGNSPAVNAVDTPNVCFRARDQGTCDRTGCAFRHDEGLLKPARKEKADRESGHKGKDKGGTAKGKGKGKGKGADATTDGAKELCLRFMKGECAKSAANCRFSHAAKRINALVAAVGTAQQKGYVVTSSQAKDRVAPPGLRHTPPAVQAAAQLNALAPVYSPAANALTWVRPECSVIFGSDIAQQSTPQVAFVDVAASSSNSAIRSLDDLPKDIWEFVPEPPSGYHYRTLTQVGVEEVETLLDGGSVFSLMSEEYFVELINSATSRGMTPAHEDWPIAGLQHWGADSPASTMSKGPALLLRAIVLLPMTLKGLGGARHRLVPSLTHI